MFSCRGRNISLLLFSLILVLYPCAPSAAEKTIHKTKYFQVRQAHANKNGVLVSKPFQLDKKLLTLFLQQSIININDYARWLKDNISYVKDPGKDYWAPPFETLVNKKGDCEDFAFLTSSALQVLGYKTHVLALTAPDRSHAVCAFRFQDTYYWFDNEKLKKTDAKSLKDLATVLLKRYKYSRILEFDPTTSGWRLIKKTG